MMSGDGLLVRVRPRMARLSAEQVLRLADLAEDYGNGLIDLSSRGNLQIRGVAEEAHPVLLDALISAGLVHADPAREVSLTVTPFPDAAGETEALVAAVEAVAADLPALPDKMGVLVDTGGTRWLADTSGDFRFERAKDSLILRADGAEAGRPVTCETAGAALLELAEWFIATDGAESRRMRHHLEGCVLPQDWCKVVPEKACPPPAPDVATGHLGVAFGQMTSADFRDLISNSNTYSVIFTPWRSVLLTDISVVPTDISVTATKAANPGTEISVSAERHRLAEALAKPGSSFITSASDPRLNVVACPGAPGCAQSSIETRALAARLAPHTRDLLHVSGCAKGCARQQEAPVVLVGRDGVFDLVQGGKAQDDPIRTAISENEVIAYLREHTKRTDAVVSGDVRTGARTDEGSPA
jgi:precorrin-3B synthase